MRTLQFGAMFVAALTFLCGCQRDISGTYLASNSGDVVWLQLVRTPDNRLSGQIITTSVRPDGTLDDKNASLTGAVDGENVTLNIGSFLGLQSNTLSGTFSGDTLSLTNGDPTPLTLKRSPLSAYQTKMAELNSRSQALLAARVAAANRQSIEQAERAFEQTVTSLANRMKRFDAEADVHLGRFPNVENGYRSITAKVAGYVNRERQLVGNPNAAVARSQLDVSANQASLATDQVHLQGESLESSLDVNIKPLADQAMAIENECKQQASGPASLTASEAQAHTASCDQLLQASPRFRQKYDATKSGLAHLEQVYRTEKKAQEALLKEAEKLE